MDIARLQASFLTAWRRVRTYALSHKGWSAAIAIVVLGGGWYAYGKITAPSTTPEYYTTAVATSTVVAAIDETGQVEASRQLNLSPKASGQIVYLPVVTGQHVGAGQILAELDATDAQQALADAKLSLATAQLTYQQNTAPSKAIDVLKANNGVTNAQTALQKAHDDAYASIANTYADLGSLVSSLDNILHNSNAAGRPTQQNLDAYADIVSPHDDSISIYKSSAQTSYTAAVTAYNTAVAHYKATSRSATNDQIVALASETYTAAEAVADAVTNAHDFFDRVNSDYTLYNLGSSGALTTLLATATTNTNTVASDLSAALSTKTNIVSAEQTLAEAQDTQQTTQTGPDAIAQQSATLALQKAQEAVTNAQQNLEDYIIRAPFAGTIAAVPVQKYDQASSGTTVATIITNQETVALSVNEIDASKLKAGEKATITFDALPGITIAGTLASIDVVGAVSSGVVSYGATVTFDTPNASVKPGMSASVSIVTATGSGLAVPSSAVKTVAGASYVQVFTPPLVGSSETVGIQTSDTPTRVPVTLGISDDTTTLITSGLTEGEQVVSRTGTAPTVAKSAAAQSTSVFGGAAGGARPTGGATRGAVRIGG